MVTRQFRKKLPFIAKKFLRSHRRFFRQFEKGIFHKTAMETVFAHLQSPDLEDAVFLRSSCISTQIGLIIILYYFIITFNRLYLEDAFMQKKNKAECGARTAWHGGAVANTCIFLSTEETT